MGVGGEIPSVWQPRMHVLLLLTDPVSSNSTAVQIELGITEYVIS
jgi:hypothetical protein